MHVHLFPSSFLIACVCLCCSAYSITLFGCPPIKIRLPYVHAQKHTLTQQPALSRNLPAQLLGMICASMNSKSATALRLLETLLSSSSTLPPLQVWQPLLRLSARLQNASVASWRMEPLFFISRTNHFVVLSTMVASGFSSTPSVAHSSVVSRCVATRTAPNSAGTS